MLDSLHMAKAPRKLLFSVSIHDCKVEAIASTGGGGGQNKNRRHSAIRITHEPSGAVGFSADERDQLRNKRAAWVRLAGSRAFQSWQRRISAEILSGKSVDDLVDESMAPKHLKIELRTPSGWSEEPLGSSGLDNPSNLC